MLARSSVSQIGRVANAEWANFNDIIITSHPITLSTNISLQPQSILPLPCLSPLSCTQVAGKQGGRWLSHNMSDSPPRQYTFPSCEASFLGSNYWPNPPLILQDPPRHRRSCSWVLWTPPLCWWAGAPRWSLMASSSTTVSCIQATSASQSTCGKTSLRMVGVGFFKSSPWFIYILILHLSLRNMDECAKINKYNTVKYNF